MSSAQNETSSAWRYRIAVTPSISAFCCRAVSTVEASTGADHISSNVSALCSNEATSAAFNCSGVMPFPFGRFDLLIPFPPQGGPFDPPCNFCGRSYSGASGGKPAIRSAARNRQKSALPLAVPRIDQGVETVKPSKRLTFRGVGIYSAFRGFPYRRTGMKASAWIDKVRAARAWPSDYRVAKEFGLRASTLSRYRSHDVTLDDSIALQVARALGAPPEMVLLDQLAERSKVPEAAAVLRRLADGLYIMSTWLFAIDLVARCQLPD
jgi:hypothetical protein